MMPPSNMKDFLIKHKWPLIVAAAALLVRLVYLIELSTKPGFSVPMVDELWHWEWAHEILNKSFWGEGAYFRAPLYPYFLAFLTWITDSSIFWSKLLQLLLCGGTAIFLYRLADRLFDRRVAIISGFIYAFYGTLVFYETMYLIPVLFLFLIVWGMYRLVAYADSPSLKTWLVTGLIFGLAALARPNVLVVIPFLMLWLFFRHRQPLVRSKRVLTPLLLLVGVMVAIAPVTVRNKIVTGDFILISSQGGVNFYIGNNEYANGLWMAMPEIDLNQSITWSQFIPITKQIAEKEAGQPLSDAEQSAFWTGKAVDFIIDHPGHFVSLVFRKSVYLLSGFENSDNTDIYYQRGKSYLFSALLWDMLVYFPFGMLLPLSLVGIYLCRRDLKKLWPLYIFLLAYAPTITLFLVTARHRLPLLPFLIVLAAAGLVKLRTARKQRQVRQVIIALVIIHAAALATNRTYFDIGSSNPFQIHFNNGIKFERLEDYAAAEKEYLAADALYPYSPSLINNLGFIQYRLGKIDKAENNYHRAIRIKPEYGRPYNNLGLIVRDRGDNDSALVLFQNAIVRWDTLTSTPDELGQYYMNMADAYEDVGQIDSAGAAFLNAVSSAPLVGRVYYRAAAFFSRYHQFTISDNLFVAGRKHHDPTGSDLFNWGLSLMQRQRYSEGLALMNRVLKIDPELYQAYYLIAFAHHQGGSPSDTVRVYLDNCLQADPNYEPALELKQLLK